MFREIETTKGIVNINTDNVAYVDTFALKTRIVMTNNEVFISEKCVKDVLLDLKNDQVFNKLDDRILTEKGKKWKNSSR